MLGPKYTCSHTEAFRNIAAMGPRSASVEYEYPIILNTLGVVAFSDWGTLATTLWDDDAGLWRLTAGFGLRVVIPTFGDRPLAFDFAFPIFSEDEDEDTPTA